MSKQKPYMPCDIDDVFYYPWWLLDESRIFEARVRMLTKRADGTWTIRVFPRRLGFTVDFNEADIGTRIFRTREEAEEYVAQVNEIGGKG